MGQGFHETAHNRIDLKKFKENYVAIFPEKKDDYCADCGYKPSFCECNLECKHAYPSLDEIKYPYDLVCKYCGKEKEDAIPGTV